MNDLLIIGAGPGGYELALKASQKGLKTVLIEKNRLGGVCLHSGCIPTKAWIKTAEVLREAQEFAMLGIQTSGLTLNFSEVCKRKQLIIETLEEGIRFALEKAKVQVVYGEAKLIKSHQVQVGETLYEASSIVIATGSRPLMIPGFQEAWDSTQLLDATSIPTKLIIIGGGIIGIEMACMMQAFGSQVTVVEFMDRILPTADREISKRLQAYVKKQGIVLYLGAKANKMDDHGVFIESKGQLIFLEADNVLVAVGRRPNIEGLGLEDLGIQFTPKGIQVNDSFQTNISNIYAIGDVTGKMMLAHVATYQGYQVLHQLLHEESHIRFEFTPSCVFSFPEVAWVGLSEDGLDLGSFITYKSLYRVNGKAQALNATDGFVKILVRDQKIIGVHIIGLQASALIQEMSALMHLNMSVNVFKDIIHAHPTLNEILHSCFQE